MTDVRPAPATLTVRDATADDARACAAIYAPYVTSTAITFEAEPPSAAEMASRILSAGGTHSWLVCERRGQVAGYAYGSPFAAREAYRWSCEVTVYCEPGLRRSGAGRALYGVLLPRLTGRGYRTAVAKIALPNDASLGLHRAFGFEDVGVHRSIGFKLGAWHDVAVCQLRLADSPGHPAEPR